MDPKVAVLLLAVAGRLAAVSVRAGASPNAVSTTSSSASKPVTPSAPLKELQDDDVDGGGGEAEDADDGRGREPAGAAPGGEYSVEYVSDKKQGVVVGSYSLVGADGSQRTLQYSADPVHGFTAVVRRDAGVGAALFVKAPPVSAPPPAPAPWAGPAVVLVRPQEQQQLVLGPTPLPPLPPPPPPQLLVTPAPSTRIVSIGVHRPQAEVVNIGGDTRKAAGPGRVHLNGPHFLLSAQPLPLFTYAAAPAGVPAYAPGGTFAAPPGAAPALGPPPPFLFLGQQQASSGTSDPQPHRAVFSLLQYAPPSLPPPPPQPAARSRFPHPDPPVHFATAPGYTSAVFTAFSNPFVSYAYR